MTICAISGHFRWRVAAILFLFLALLSHTFAQGAAPPMQTPIDLGAVPESQMLTAPSASSGCSRGVTGCTGTNFTGSPASTTSPATTAPTDPGSALGTQLLTITAAGSDGTNTVRHDFSSMCVQ